MKKILMIGSFTLSLALFGCAQYEDGEPVEDTSTASEPAEDSETNELSAVEKSADEVEEIEEVSEASFEEEITEIVHETIGEDKVTDLVALSDDTESTMSVTFQSDDFNYGPAGKDNIEMIVAETLIKLKDLDAPPFYDITFISKYDGLDTADNIIFRANYDQDTLDNHVSEDPHEFRRQLEDISVGYYIDSILEE